MFSLTAENISFRYKTEKEFLLENISLNIRPATVTVISGLSGIGKTTLCYLLSGIIPRIYKGEIRGEIKLFGEKITDLSAEAISSKLGIVFQDPETQLFMPLVEDELAFAPENFCLSREEIEKRITDSLATVGMEKFRYHEVNTLSGGQKQLIATASVLTMDPQILIFDEIMSQIDKAGKQKIRDLIITLKKEKKTIIMVEHDMSNLDLADEVYVLQNKTLNRLDG